MDIGSLLRRALVIAGMALLIVVGFIGWVGSSSSSLNNQSYAATAANPDGTATLNLPPSRAEPANATEPRTSVSDALTPAEPR